MEKARGREEALTTDRQLSELQRQELQTGRPQPLSSEISTDSFLENGVPEDNIGWAIVKCSN